MNSPAELPNEGSCLRLLLPLPPCSPPLPPPLLPVLLPLPPGACCSLPVLLPPPCPASALMGCTRRSCCCVLRLLLLLPPKAPRLLPLCEDGGDRGPWPPLLLLSGPPCPPGLLLLLLPLPLPTPRGTSVPGALRMSCEGTSTTCGCCCCCLRGGGGGGGGCGGGCGAQLLLLPALLGMAAPGGGGDSTRLLLLLPDALAEPRPEKAGPELDRTNPPDAGCPAGEEAALSMAALDCLPPCCGPWCPPRALLLLPLPPVAGVPRLLPLLPMCAPAALSTCSGCCCCTLASISDSKSSSSGSIKGLGRTALPPPLPDWLLLLLPLRCSLVTRAPCSCCCCRGCCACCLLPPALGPCEPGWLLPCQGRGLCGCASQCSGCCCWWCCGMCRH